MALAFSIEAIRIEPESEKHIAKARLAGPHHLVLVLEDPLDSKFCG
jgi:hypothetical protein